MVHYYVIVQTLTCTIWANTMHYLFEFHYYYTKYIISIRMITVMIESTYNSDADHDNDESIMKTEEDYDGNFTSYIDNGGDRSIAESLNNSKDDDDGHNVETYTKAMPMLTRIAMHQNIKGNCYVLKAIVMDLATVTLK